MARPNVLSRMSGTLADFTLYAGRILLVEYRDGAVIEENTADIMRPEAKQVVGDGPYVAIVDARGLAYAEIEGRRRLSDTPPDRVAMAIVADTKVLQYLAERFLTERSDAPEATVFRNVDEAFEWAQQISSQWSGEAAT